MRRHQQKQAEEFKTELAELKAQLSAATQKEMKLPKSDEDIEDWAKDYPDVAASFQEAVVDVLVKKLAYAIEQTGIKKLVCSGGVAANSLLRERLTDMGKTSELEVSYPKMEFCTDNAAMIAYAGFIRKKYNLKEYPTKFARPRWPLGELYD